MASKISSRSSEPGALFHPDIRHWFAHKFTAPTAVQQAAWPVVARGDHTLITAPTGSGKTLTAFLWSINRFATGDWKPGATRVVYISPLKALNNDIQRNLLGPLSELVTYSADFPQISVQTRSGDTSQSDRQRMLRKPPDILITTPESLSLLLTSERGRRAMHTVETLIIDEVHSIVDNRRGISLMTCAERLLDISGRLQRIALSATVNPLQTIAEYVGGYDRDGQPRTVTIVNPPTEKEITLQVRYPHEVKEASDNGISVWDALADKFRELAIDNRSTLFFTNSRAMAEKITLKINARSPTLLAYAHHGSLSRDIRTEVERRLKNEELRAIVATSSLEMGIDIGNLDKVVLMQSPPGIAATVQRIGRAGHSVGEASHGLLYPVHAADFVEAAALSEATIKGDLEPLKPMVGALDILSQIIVSMCATEEWQVDDMYQLLRQSTPYRHLAREQFDLVLDLLAGRYAGVRIRELAARIVYNRIEGIIAAKKSALFALYNSGGSIPDRGYYQIRHANSGVKIGELDEEFVWEARTGDIFSLGTQNWQVKQITHNDVFVTQAKDGLAPPFWRAERYNRSAHYATRIGEFLQCAELYLDSNDKKRLRQFLSLELAFDDLAAEKLLDYLQRQREASGVALPHRYHVVVELIAAGPGGYRGPDNQKQLVIHTHWGGKLNHPWALAMQSAWNERFSERIELHADNDAIVLQINKAPDPAELLALVTPSNLEQHLRAALEGSGYFGTRFRECAGRFLLLPRQRFNQRLPLWMSRLQAKKLMSATLHLETFPVLLETWRTCLQDEFDLPMLRERLTEINDGICQWSFVNTATPTPFAANLSFDQINKYMYADDTPEQAHVSALSDDLIKMAVNDSSIRPAVSRDICNEFAAKRRRLHPEYRPADDLEWSEWVKERLLLPHEEWWENWSDEPAKYDRWLCELHSGQRRWVCHLENVKLLIDSGLSGSCTIVTYRDIPIPNVGSSRDPIALAVEILSFYEPLTLDSITKLLPKIPAGFSGESIPTLTHGQLVSGDHSHFYCDTENFEILLRWQRAARRPQFQTLPISGLPQLFARLQHFHHQATDNSIIETIESLRGYSTQIQTLFYDLFAARLAGYSDHLLDRVFAEQELCWLGTHKGQCTLCYPEDIELLKRPADETEHDPLANGFVDPNASYSYQQLADHLDNCVDDIDHAWWQSVWSGRISADNLAPLRKGIQSNYRLNTPDKSNSVSVRRRARPGSGGWPGNWRLLPNVSETKDPLSELEKSRELVHLLLDRYGIVSREIANREGGVFKWKNLFKALRVMELSGEVTQGLFYDQLSGPQFINLRALNRLQHPKSLTSTFWCSAVDPASPCGLGLDWPELPTRRAQNFLSFHNGKLALVIENLGRKLHFYVEATDVDLDSILAPCTHIACTRNKMQVDEINNQPVRTSEYLPVLKRILKYRSDHRRVYFEQ